MKPLVSILIPAYNAQPWIADTIKSALAQTWPRKEIIVVDDGSTDHTLAVARQFASKDVKVTSHPNQGASASRNKAFAICQGDYIQWLDADDLLAPDKITLQMEVLKCYASKRMLASSAVGYFFYRPAKAEFHPSLLWCDLSPMEWLLRKMEHNAQLQAGTWLISRELMESSGPWDTRLSTDDDGDYSCRLILASEGIRFVREARLFYRMSNPGSLSHAEQSKKNLESQFLSLKLQIDHLRSFQDSERLRSAILKYMQAELIYFYPERIDIVKELEQIAAALGGQLGVPRLRWKYAWIRWIFGWTAAKWVQLHYNQRKSSFLRSWDKALFLLTNLSTSSNDY
jgi:glycosyltransferase involved in cell wall biosynthesis